MLPTFRPMTNSTWGDRSCTSAISGEAAATAVTALSKYNRRFLPSRTDHSVGGAKSANARSAIRWSHSSYGGAGAGEVTGGGAADVSLASSACPGAELGLRGRVGTGSGE